MSTTTHGGGCQCGKVRYTAELASNEAYLCHCRMCQRATGGVAAAMVGVPDGAVTWQGQPEWYASSPIAQRPFCAACGTPLGFRYNDGTGLDLTVGSFDDPSVFGPVAHGGVESLHEAWIDTRKLPRQRTHDSKSSIAHWSAVGKEVP